VREIGFGDMLIQKVLLDLCELRFIHTTSHRAPTFESNYVVSRLGGHIVRNFIANFVFIENVMVDTFISDEVVWSQLKSLTAKIYAERNTISKFRLRKGRAQVFYAHVTKLYNGLYEESIRRGLPKEWCAHPLRTMANEFESNLKRALASAERNYGAGAHSGSPAEAVIPHQ
jgi:hypothetical protein